LVQHYDAGPVFKALEDIVNLECCGASGKSETGEHSLRGDDTIQDDTYNLLVARESG
jgi:hypothetical protein